MCFFFVFFQNVSFLISSSVLVDYLSFKKKKKKKKPNFPSRKIVKQPELICPLFFPFPANIKFNFKGSNHNYEYNNWYRFGGIGSIFSPRCIKNYRHKKWNRFFRNRYRSRPITTWKCSSNFLRRLLIRSLKFRGLNDCNK